MANLLARLAERTLGLAPVAKPAIAPLFAPAAPATIGGPAPGLRPAAPREPAERPETVQEATRGPSRRREDAPPAMAPPAEKRVTEDAGEQRRAEPRIAAENARAVIFVPGTRGESRSLERPIDEKRLPPPVTPVEAQVIEAAAPVEPRVRAQARRETENFQSVPPAEPATRITPEERRKEPARTALPPLLWAPKKTELEPAGRRAQQEDRGLQDSAIEVNIGRIELRAVFPPPPPAAPVRQRPDPALSLADYLKQRDRGER